MKTTNQQSIIASYQNQHYRFGPLTIGPTDEPDPTIPNGFIISEWSPKGETLTLEENEDRGWKLLTKLSQQELKFKRIITVEATRAWVEDSFFVQNITLQQAIKLAKDQLGFVQLENGQAIIWINNQETIRQNLGVIETQYGCPAKENGKVSDDPCKQHGYWSTSAAMSALSNWRNNLTIVLSRLGCNLCNNATTHPSNLVKTSNPNHIQSIKVTNRASANQWVRL